MASKDIDMIIAQGGTSEHHAMGMESRGGDGRGAVVLQEASVGLDAVEEGAVDVVKVHAVAFGAAVMRALIKNSGWVDRDFSRRADKSPCTATGRRT